MASSYEVFLSFRGEDTRKTFVDHLYTSLVQQGIHTYKDDETLPRGESIGPSLLKAIRESPIAVIVFSENYADSSSCLDELAYIMECMTTRGQIVLPVFYHVDNSDVRRQKGKYGEAFGKHELENNQKVKLWKNALRAAGNLYGWVTKGYANGHEAKCIKDIVGSISKKLPLISKVSKDLIGIETRLQDLKSMLETGPSGGVRIIGIWGVGGSGKTTLASAAYTEMSVRFEGHCFLENIREESNKHGLKMLQKNMLLSILKTEVPVESEEQGIWVIKRRLCHKKVLVVLDNVDDLKQIEGLAGSHDWFGEGSRIIITTRNEHMLTRKADSVYGVSLLSHDEAIELFHTHAYREDNPVEDYEMLSEKVVSYAGGLPLVLEVLGKFLYDKDKDEWKSALTKFKDIPYPDVMERLKISYDGLYSDEKDLFLDIASSSSHLIPRSSFKSWNYEVFLSFRGEDTRKTFVDHLYTSLEQQGIHTYNDDETLPLGESIGPSILKALHESQIAVIVFSENYAASSWCLDELAYIMECMTTRGQIVMPVFYDVDPSDVRKQKGKYGEAFGKHELENNHKVKLWKNALATAANLSGLVTKDYANGHEAKCIKDIVGLISRKLYPINSKFRKDLIGIDPRLQDLISKLEPGSSGAVRIVGIWGIGGGGKTTLASAAYTVLSVHFEGHCFLQNIRKESRKHGLKMLQKNMLLSILKTEVPVESEEQGRSMIKRRLCRKKVLVVLDDVDDLKQIEDLAGSHDWFGEGSRIIITTRDEHMLTRKADSVYRVSLLSHDEAIELFHTHAYREDNPVEGYEILSEKVVSYAGGLPLVLEFLGKFLYGKDKDEWKSALTKLKDIPIPDVMEKLKISYDGLDSDEKDLFLNIACFHRKRTPIDDAMKVLDACSFNPVIGVRVLVQKSLIYESNGVFDMHDLIEDMAHYIVRGKGTNYPEKHSRVWKSDDAMKVLDAVNTAAGNLSGWVTKDYAKASSSVITPELQYTISPNGRLRASFKFKTWKKGKLLGSGSFGTVYGAINEFGHFFAVKEVSLLDQSSQGKQSIVQLEQEISLLSQFNHENIVQYIGTDSDDGKLYIFLELVTKGSLSKLYKEYELQDSQVSAYTRQILSGLNYLHEQNVVHRDIKCANILVDASGSVKLADFGLAKATTLNDIKSFRGTPFWMAPEVANANSQAEEGYGLKADIWSLGCTVLEMLTRDIPDYGVKGLQAVFKIRDGERPKIPDTLSAEAQDFIDKCLQVKPNDRPTAAELLEHPFLKRPTSMNLALPSPHHNSPQL